MDIIHKNIYKSELKIRVLSLFFTISFLLGIYIIFLLAYHIFSYKIDSFFNDFLDGKYGLFFEHSSNFILLKILVFLEVVFSPFLYLFIIKYKKIFLRKEFFITFFKSTIIFFTFLIVVLLINEETFIFSGIFLSIVLLLLLFMVYFTFFRVKNKLFQYTFLFLPIYILFQFVTPAFIPSEINYVASELKMNNIEESKKKTFEESKLGIHVDANSALVKLFPILESYDDMNYDNVKNELNLILPNLSDNQNSGYFFLEKNNFLVICYQLRKEYWNECRNYIRNNLDNGFTKNKIINKEFINVYDQFLQEYNDIKDYDNLYYKPNRYNNNYLLSYSRGYQMHHFQNFESPLYNVPSNKLPNSQYGNLSLKLVDFIGNIVSNIAENDKIFKTVISGPQILNIMMYILLLVLLWILKNDNIVKSLISLSIFTSLLLLLYTTDTFAPGLSIFRIFPQLVLIIFAFSQLHKNYNSLYLTVPSLTIYLSCFLMFYNFEFAIFSMLSAIIAIVVSSGNLKQKLILIFIGMISFIVYLDIKNIIIDNGPLNVRFLNYLTNVGIPYMPITTEFIVISILVILPIFVLFKGKEVLSKTNVIFIMILSMLMFIKYIWNPSNNHLASIFPFIFFPWITLHYIRNFNKSIYIKCYKYYKNIIKDESNIRSFSKIKLYSWYIKYFILYFMLHNRYINLLFLVILSIFVVGVCSQTKGFINKELNKYYYISNFKMDIYSAFPRKVYVDSSISKIFSDYQELISNRKEKIFLVTPHDNMLSFMGKIHTNSPYTDFTTNIRTQSDMIFIIEKFKMEDKKYCTVSDRIDLFYHLPYKEEMSFNLENFNTYQNTYESSKTVKNLASIVNSNLKLVTKSKYFELHCQED